MNPEQQQSLRIISYYRKSAEEYDKEYDVPYMKQLYDKITWHFIEAYLPHDGLVLDAGGGTGKWTIPIAEKGLHVVLLDISREMLNVARRKVKDKQLGHLVMFYQGDICNIGFPEDSFDFILAEGDPISYCSNPKLAVRELARVLKPGQYIEAGVDSLFSVVRGFLIRKGPEEAMTILRNKKFLSEAWGFDCWAFSPDDLKLIFEQNGLDIVKIVGKPVAYVQRPETEDLLNVYERAERVLELELMLCEEPSIVGYGGHLHVVGRKRARGT